VDSLGLLWSGELGEAVGQQYPTDTGPIEILAVRKDGKELLVVELKKGRASDVVVGQVQRYMGYVKDELLENGQTVRGVIIALEDDLKLRRALSVTNNIDFYVQSAFPAGKAKWLSGDRWPTVWKPQA
jgi:restriction system protein